MILNVIFLIVGNGKTTNTIFSQFINDDYIRFDSLLNLKYVFFSVTVKEIKGQNDKNMQTAYFYFNNVLII